MSILTDLLDWGWTKISGVIGGASDPNEPLEEPLGQLETEKVKQDLEDRRRERQGNVH